MDIAGMLSQSRYKSGKSQQYVADKLNVNKSTIQNWESGYSSPPFDKVVQWFDAVSQPLYPYIMAMIYPKEIEGITADTDEEELRKALHLYVDELDALHMRELLFLLHGSHGSSPTGTLDAITAYLHMPLAMRVCITDNIVTTYEIAESVGLIKNDEHVLPEKATLKRCLSTAKEAVIQGKETYIIVEE